MQRNRGNNITGKTRALRDLSQGSHITQSVKNLPAMQETWVPFLGKEDTLEKEMATHSSILAWRIPRTEEPSGLQSMRPQRVGRKHSFCFPGGSISKESACNAGDLGSIPGSGDSSGEGNGSPLQYSCLENPMDRGACRVHPWGR